VQVPVKVRGDAKGFAGAQVEADHPVGKMTAQGLQGLGAARTDKRVRKAQAQANTFSSMT